MKKTYSEKLIKYRKLGKLDWQVSVLGFGIGRFALLTDDETVNLLRHAVDCGVNYVDLGISSDLAQHENAIRKISRALGNGYRKKVKVAATLPSSVSSLHECDRFLDSLKRLDSIDFLLLGWLNRAIWEKLQGLGILGWAEKAMSKDMFQHLGFSFHDDFQSLRSILNAYDNWTLSQFEYSFIDVEHHPGHGGLQLAAQKGLGIVVSSPLKQGRLTTRLPKSVSQLMANAEVKRTPAEWGLRWVWNHPEVSSLVDDIGSMEQLSEDLQIADNATASSLNISEEILISQIRDAYCKLKPVPCTTCRSCMPCPQNIDVPRIFELYNDAAMYGNPDIPSACFHSEGHKINDCTDCGLCLQRCGMSIPIPERLKDALKLLGGSEV